MAAIIALEDDPRGARAGDRPGAGTRRDPERYWFAVFGDPAAAGAPWSWRVGGHHVAIQLTVADGRIVGSAPSFLGANPAVVPGGPSAGARALTGEETLARALVAGLSPEQRAIAIVDPVAPPDILSGNGARADADRRSRTGSATTTWRRPSRKAWRASSGTTSGGHGTRSPPRTGSGSRTRASPRSRSPGPVPWSRVVATTTRSAARASSSSTTTRRTAPTTSTRCGATSPTTGARTPSPTTTARATRRPAEEQGSAADSQTGWSSKTRRSTAASSGRRTSTPSTKRMNVTPNGMLRASGPRMSRKNATRSLGPARWPGPLPRGLDT